MKIGIRVAASVIGLSLSLISHLAWSEAESAPAIGRLFAPAQAERGVTPERSPSEARPGQRVDGAVARSLGPNTVWLEGQVVAPGKGGITTSESLLPKVRLPDGRQAVVGESLPQVRPTASR